MFARQLLIALVRLLVGATPQWVGTRPENKQRVYFANHSSHIDTIALWSALPAELRTNTRPVAAADYWDGDRYKRYIALDILNAVLIERNRCGSASDPLEPLYTALEHGDSLIIFPEGTRQALALPGRFKSGLFHLATRFADVEFIPVYLDNLHRSMPKGTLFPVPLTCTVRFGAPMQRIAGEDKESFLSRARDAVIELSL